MICYTQPTTPPLSICRAYCHLPNKTLTKEKGGVGGGAPLPLILYLTDGAGFQLGLIYATIMVDVKESISQKAKERNQRLHRSHVKCILAIIQGSLRKTFVVSASLRKSGAEELCNVNIFVFKLHITPFSSLCKPKQCPVTYSLRSSGVSGRSTI